jgi:hypothetical protein
VSTQGGAIEIKDKETKHCVVLIPGFGNAELANVAGAGYLSDLIVQLQSSVRTKPPLDPLF